MKTITPAQENKGIETLLDSLSQKATYQQIDEKERTVKITFGYGVINQSDLTKIMGFCADYNFDINIYATKQQGIRVEMSSNQLS